MFVFDADKFLESWRTRHSAVVIVDCAAINRACDNLSFIFTSIFYEHRVGGPGSGSGRLLRLLRLLLTATCPTSIIRSYFSAPNVI